MGMEKNIVAVTTATNMMKQISPNFLNGSLEGKRFLP